MRRRSVVIASFLATLLAVAGAPSAWAKPLGHFKQFPTPTPNSAPRRIAAGSDGALWFTEFNTSKIGRITTAGAITELPSARDAAASLTGQGVRGGKSGTSTRPNAASR